MNWAGLKPLQRDQGATRDPRDLAERRTSYTLQIEITLRTRERLILGQVSHPYLETLQEEEEEATIRNEEQQYKSSE